MIIQKEVEVTVNNNKIRFYREHGFPNCKRFDKITIPIEWLGPTSKIPILCECDYCHKQYKKPYGEIVVGRKIVDKDSCYDCKYNKIVESNYTKYGVKTNLMLKENQEKSKQTVKEKYGVDNVMQNEEIKNKQAASVEKHYGVKSPIQNPEIKEKIRRTAVEKYGAEFTRGGMLLINGVFCSKTQKEICNYFNFEINAFIKQYCVDGLKNNIIIEYNGGGHDIAVQKEQISREDFDKKEKGRLDNLIKLGYSVLVIENKEDLPLSEKDYNNLKDIINNLSNSQIKKYQVEGSTTIENVSEQSSL